MPGRPHRSPPLRRRGQAVSDAILAASYAEIAEHGFPDASIARIAARAGVHETSIYRRFGTRAQLLLDTLLWRSDETVPVPDTGTLRGDLVAIVRAVSDSYRTPLGAAVVHSSVIALTGHLADRQQFWTRRVERLQIVLDRAEDRGELRADLDLALVFEMVIAPLHARLAVTGFDLEPDLPERVVDIVLRGVLAEEATSHDHTVPAPKR